MSKQLSKISSRLVLLVIMVFVSFYFSSTDAVATIYSVFGGGCRDWEFDTRAECEVVAFCDDGVDNVEMINAGAWSAVTCPNHSPTVLNEARADGVIGGPQISASAKATSVGLWRFLGEASYLITCHGISSGYNSTIQRIVMD